MLTPIGINRFRLANTEFICAMKLEPSTPSVLYVTKSADVLAEYHLLRDTLHFASVLQLTGFDSANVALTCLVGAPRRVVSVSSADVEPVALKGFAERRGFDELTTYVGISADDRPSLQRVIDQEFGVEPLEVVVDDISTSRPAALRAFDLLFPQLVVGGRYVIERWGWDHRGLSRFLERTDGEARDRLLEGAEARIAAGDLLALVVPQLVAVAVAHPEVVASVRVHASWVLVERGPATLDPDTFELGTYLANG